jgi:hypothetical protein
VTPSSGDYFRLAVYSSSSSCPTDVPASGSTATVLNSDVSATSTSQYTSGVFVSTMASRAAVSSCTYANDITITLCVYYIPGSSSSTSAQLASSGTFNYQLAIPPAPKIASVTLGNAQLSVSVLAGDTDTNHTATSSITYEIGCTAEGGGSSSTGGPSSAGTLQCGGLTNQMRYVVVARAYSSAGNVGPDSAKVGPDDTTTPLPFLSFWDVYKDGGGLGEGGCSHGGTGAFSLFIAVLAVVAIRRRRSC